MANSSPKNKLTDAGGGCPAVSCFPLFCPGQCAHYAEIYIAESNEEARKILSKWEDGFHGLMHYDHYTKLDHKSTIVLLRERLSIPLMVHEITHAALEWVNGVTMIAAYEQGEEDLEGYYSEALARVVEAMTRQGLSIFKENAEGQRHRNEDMT